MASGYWCCRVGLGGLATVASLTVGGVGLGLVGDRDPGHALPHGEGRTDNEREREWQRMKHD